MKKLHEYASLFPPQSDEEFEALCGDVKENGLLQPIVLIGDAILDGVHRARACEKMRVTPRYVKYEGSDPLGFVMSVNMHRRHLTSDQRAVIASDLALLLERPRGGDHKSAEAKEKVQNQKGSTTPFDLDKKATERAAKTLCVGDKKVKTAVWLKKNRPDLHEKVRGGKLKLGEARSIATPREKRLRAKKRATPDVSVLIGKLHRNIDAFLKRDEEKWREVGKFLADIHPTARSEFIASLQSLVKTPNSLLLQQQKRLAK